MKVLLVGNSSIDKSKKYGKLVDDFDVVIRMNRYRLEGYEEYLGTKTNIWVLNRAISLGKSRLRVLEVGPDPLSSNDTAINTKFNMNKKLSKDLEYMLMLTYVPEWKGNQGEIQTLQKQVKKHKDFRVGDTRGVSKYLFSRWNEVMREKWYKPATGLISIHYFLETYDKIYLHNFDCGKSKHYWGDLDIQSEPMSSKHNWSFDEIVIDELVESGKVSYL